MKKQLVAGAFASVLLSYAPIAFAQNCHESSNHSLHTAAGTPAGVMGDHVMPKGKWMAAYRFDHISQTGFLQGDSKVSKQELLHHYSEAPLKMQMDMHMLEGMVGVTNELTLMAMAQYMTMDMVHQAHEMPGMPTHIHEMDVQGWGDTQVTGVYQLSHTQQGNQSQSFLLNAGASLPTGSIDKSYLNHHNTLRHLPYNMQFGSGTFDPIIGATYTAQMGEWSWGTQALGVFRLYDNSNDYRLGNRYTVNLWAGKTLTNLVDASLRLEGIYWGKVSGADPMIPATSMVGATSALTGGEQINAYLGFGFAPPLHALEGIQNRLSLELGAPIYQHFDGPLLETDYRLIMGWRTKF